MYGGVKPDAQSVAGRQQAINAAYDKLVQTAEVCVDYICLCMCVFMNCVTYGLLQSRQKRLEDSVKQFALFRECDDVESWITEKVCLQS